MAMLGIMTISLRTSAFMNFLGHVASDDTWWVIEGAREMLAQFRIGELGDTFWHGSDIDVRLE